MDEATLSTSINKVLNFVTCSEYVSMLSA